MLVVMDLIINAVQKWWWPTRIEIWQELEQDLTIMKKLAEVGGEGGYGVGCGKFESEDVQRLEEMKVHEEGPV
jgi:hypothetical protein